MYPTMRDTDGSELFNTGNFALHINLILSFAKEK
jgi:hypothetical protein